MARNTRTLLQREEQRRQIAIMLRRGLGQDTIAERLDISQQQVSYDVAVIRRRLLDAQNSEQEVMRAEKRAQYEAIREAAWEAWDKSQSDTESLSEESALRSSPGARKGTFVESFKKIKSIFQRKGRLPANEFLRTVLETLKAEREMYGLDAPASINLNAKVQTIDWTAFINDIAGRPPLPDRVVDEIVPDPLQQAIEEDRRAASSPAVSISQESVPRKSSGAPARPRYCPGCGEEWQWEGGPCNICGYDQGMTTSSQ